MEEDIGEDVLGKLEQHQEVIQIVYDYLHLVSNGISIDKDSEVAEQIMDMIVNLE